MIQHDRINPPDDTAKSLGESVEPKDYEKVLRELQTELCSESSSCSRIVMPRSRQVTEPIAVRGQTY